MPDRFTADLDFAEGALDNFSHLLFPAQYSTSLLILINIYLYFIYEFSIHLLVFRNKRKYPIYLII